MHKTSPIRAYRARKKLSCAALASQLGIAESTLRSIENGNRPVTPQFAMDVEKVTGGEITRIKLLPEFFRPIERASA